MNKKLIPMTPRSPIVQPPTRVMQNVNNNELNMLLSIYSPKQVDQNPLVG